MNDEQQPIKIPETEIIPGEVRIIEATSEIRYPYVFYLPISAAAAKNAEIFLWGAGSLSGDNLLEQAHEIRAREIPFQVKQFCDDRHKALIIPALPRDRTNRTIPTLDSQILSRDTMINEYAKEFPYFHRADDEILNMLSQITKDMHTLDIKVEPKIIAGGVSAGGNLTNRLSILYPKLFRAVAIMCAGDYMYPTSKVDDLELVYPFGTQDISKITGRELDIIAFKKIKHFVFVGEKDIERNKDPLGHETRGNGALEMLLRNVLGKTQRDRAHHFASYLTEIGVHVEFLARDDLGHNTDKKVVEQALGTLS